MERSSFFNAELKGEEYDRVYLAEDYARYFASFIGNGVFPTPSTNLQVVADGNTMNLILKQGKAWINGYFYENTEDLILSVDVADGVLNRIDRVVLRLDFINREIKAYIKKGEFASSPVAPVLQRDADMYELGIADININKGITKLVQADVTDLRQNNNYCGLVNGVVQQIDTTNLFTQFQSSFDIWFEHIKNQLSEDAAGNLQLQIDTWNDFKANGGEIGGNIVRVNHEKQYDWIFGHSGFTDKSAMISLKDRVTQATMGLNFNLKPGVSSSISPTSNGEMDFGLPNYTFKDIYVGSVSENSNGYTKLPNGMILQWGKKTLPMNNDHTAMSSTNFPITFPTEALVVIAGNVDNSAWRYPDITCGAKITSKAAFTLWAGSTRANTGTININLSWIAIGY